MARTYVFRVTSEGVDRLQKELEAAGLAGKRAFDILSEASTSMGRQLTPASAQVEALRGKLQGLQQQLADSRAQKSAAEYDRLANSARQLADRYDPLAAAQRRFAENVDIANRALASGALSIAQHVKVLNGETLALSQLEAGFRRSQGVIAGGAGTFRSFGGVVQQAGYQIGDFAVQIASGQNPLRAFIQQGTQLISMFGPWGAGIGAVGAVVGALATAYLGLGNETKKAEAAQEAYNKTLDQAGKLMDEIHGKAERNRESLEAERRNLIGIAQLKYDQAKRDLEAMPDKKIGVFDPATGVQVGEEENPVFTSRAKQVEELRRQLVELQAVLGMFDDGRAFAGITSGTEKTATAASRELDKVIAGLRQDADLAGLSGRAHAERQAILRAEQAALNDVAAGLRVSKDLNADERAAVVAAADAAYDKAEALKAAGQAQKQNLELDKARAKAAEDANKALDQQIIGIEEETYQLGLSDRERFVRQKLLEAENIALRGGISLTADRIQQLQIEASALFDTSAAIKDKKDAEEQATREAERQAKEREKIAEREAELQLQPYKNAISGIQSAWTDGWEKALSGQISSFEEFFSTVKQTGIRWAAEMVSLMTFRPVVGGILGGVAPSLASAMGFGGSGSAAAAAQNAGGSGIGGLFTASAAPLAAMFGGAGQATTGIGSWLNGLFGGPATNAAGFRMTGAGPMASMAGGLPGWASFLNTGLGTGLVGAALSAGLSLASGGSALQAGISGGGSLIGGLAGSVFGQPVLGAALGGIAGNIISSLFGGKEKKPPKQQSITNIEALSSGYFGAGDTTTKHSGDVTSELGRSAANAINTFLASIGGKVSGQAGGQVLYYGRTPRFMSTVGGVTNQYGEDAQGAQDAVADFIARTMVEAAKSSKLEGVSEAVRTAIANSGAKDAAALDAAVAFGKFYDRVDKIRTPADAAAKAMADLAAEMSKAEANAQEYGLSVEKLPEIFRQNFIADIEDQILQLKDPTAAALKQLELDKAAAIAQANSLGADLNAVEELYGLKRQAIVEQGLRGVSGSFQEFFNGLLTDSNLSALSPKEQYRVTKAAFEGASNDNLIAAATPFLQASRGMFASTKGYADDFRAVLERVKAAGGLTSDIPFFAKGGEHAGGWMVAGEQGAELIASGPARVFDAETTAAIMAAANADLSPAMMAKIVKSLGEGPDTELAHLMPEEIADLTAMRGGRPPLLNPVTLLPAFRYDRADTKAAGTSGTAGGDRGRTSSGSGKNGGGSASGNAAAAAAAAFVASSTNLAGPNPGDIAGGGIVGPNGYLGQGGSAGNQGSSTLGHDAVDRGWAEYGSDKWVEQQDKVKAAIAAGVSPTDITKAAEAYAQRLNDYNDRYNTFGEDVGNFFASWLGFNEIAPTLDFNNLNPLADWGFDPAGLIGGLVGMGFGLPFGGGIIADLISRMLGRPLEMNLGPSALTADPDMATGVSNALAAQGASDISLGGVSVAASSSSVQSSGGVVAGGDSPRSLSSLFSGGQAGSSGLKGLEQATRTSTGTNAQLDLVAQLLRMNNDKLDRLLTAQAQTNDVLKQNTRGSTRI